MWVHPYGPSKHWENVFFINFRDQTQLDFFISWYFMPFGPIENEQKLIFLHISTYNRSRPMGSGPTSPSDFFLEISEN